MTQREGFGVVCCQCCIICFYWLFALAIATGVIFFDFWVGWIVQLNHFSETGNPLANGYSTLFVIPAESDAWSIFSCFLYGFLIVKAAGIVIGLLLSCCSCCIGCFARNRDLHNDAEILPLWSKFHTTSSV